MLEKYRDDKVNQNAIKLRRLIKGYRDNLKEINQEINNIYAEYLEDGELKIGKVKRLALIRDIKQQLISISKDLGKDELKIVSETLEETTKDAMLKTAYFTELGIDSITSLRVVNDKIVKSILEKEINGLVFSDRIWKNKEKLVNRVVRDVDKALIQGTDIKKLSKQIKKDFGVSAYESLRLIQTETGRVISQAQNEYYVENKELLQETMYVVTLDDKTSKICAELEGTYPTGSCPIPILDSHPKCRCVTVPIVNGWTPKTRFDNEKKERVPFVSFEEWQKQRNI